MKRKHNIFINGVEYQFYKATPDQMKKMKVIIMIIESKIHGVIKFKIDKIFRKI